MKNNVFTHSKCSRIKLGKIGWKVLSSISQKCASILSMKGMLWRQFCSSWRKTLDRRVSRPTYRFDSSTGELSELYAWSVACLRSVSLRLEVLKASPLLSAQLWSRARFYWNTSLTSCLQTPLQSYNAFLKIGHSSDTQMRSLILIQVRRSSFSQLLVKLQDIVLLEKKLKWQIKSQHQ